MEHVMVAEAFRYEGQYVTKATFNTTEVLTSSTSAVNAYREAQAQGYIDPVLLYVPKDEEDDCYAYS